MIEIHTHRSTFLGVNMYVLTCGAHALVIDPVPNPTGDEIANYALDGIIITHEHYDHICGVESWRKLYSCPVYAGNNAINGLADPKVNLSHYGVEVFKLLYPQEDSWTAYSEILDYRCTPDQTFEDHDIFTWEGNQLLIMSTPGHSAGSICILVNRKWLICGDTLLRDMPTSLRWKGSDPKVYHEVTTPVLRSLDPDTEIYPGHGCSFLLKNYRFWE